MEGGEPVTPRRTRAIAPLAAIVAVPRPSLACSMLTRDA